MDQSMILLGLSYLGCTGLGAVAGAVWAFWYVGRPITDTPPPEEPGDHMSPEQRSTLRTQVFVIVALILVGVGVVWFVGDRASDRAKLDSAEATNRALVAYSRCLRDWGAELTDELNQARTRRSAYDDADRRRNDAFADLVRVVTELREIPPTATDQDLDDVLHEFLRADDAYQAAYERLPQKGDPVPFEAPRLDCQED